MERGMGAVTYVEPMTQTLYIQAWVRRGGLRPSKLWQRTEESVLAPDSFGWRVPPIPALSARQTQQAAAVAQAQAQVAAAGLDGEDPDLVEERLYCSCGLGNATEDQRHEPSCRVWG